MRTLILAVLILSSVAAAEAQNAGGKGYDTHQQAEFDRKMGIALTRSEISRILQRRGERSLAEAVLRYMRRATATRMPDRVGIATFLALKDELLEEAKAFSFYVPDAFGEKRCSTRPGVGATSQGKKRQPICVDPTVLAAHYYEENLRRTTVSTEDRLLATVLHELAHNALEEPETDRPDDERMLRFTYLVQKTAAMGWKPSNLWHRGPNLGMDLRVGIELQVELSGTKDCFYAIRFEDGTEVVRDRLTKIVLPVSWNLALERYEYRGEPVPDLLRLRFTVTGLRSTTEACNAELRFWDSLGVPYEFRNAGFSPFHGTPDHKFSLDVEIEQ
jgi:hypothetical protein